LIAKDDRGNYFLTELGKKALAIINMVESQNVILHDEQRVITPVLIEYADKVIIDKTC